LGNSPNRKTTLTQIPLEETFVLITGKPHLLPVGSMDFGIAPHNLPRRKLPTGSARAPRLALGKLLKHHCTWVGLTVPGRRGAGFWFSLVAEFAKTTAK
jgi:hypothetical protein